jgi:hypothetical protein
MRVTLTILSILVYSLTFGRAFYFSTSGSDSYTSTQAQSSATPWASISKLNSMMSTFAAGDSILFKAGETFYGSIRWGASNGQSAKNGTSTAPYYFGSYGSGNKPIISGFSTVSGWTSLGSNRWQSSAITNGLPNAGATGTGIENGYFLIDAASGSTSFTDASNHSSSTDWDNAKAVVRLNAWRVQIISITSHSGNTFTATAMQNYTAGYGYFISDHVNTLDTQGEWYYNPSTKQITLYSTTNPSAFTVKAATQDTVMQFYDDDWIVLDGLIIEGANKWGAYHYSAANNTVKNSVVRFCGEVGIHCTQTASTSFTALNDSVYDCNDYGINVKGSGTGQTITYNDVFNIGIYPGMGVKRDPTQHSIGICNNGQSGHVYSRNHVYNVGYVGMRVVGGTSPVEYNTIHDYCKVADDGGGIYTAGSGTSTGKVIRYNMIWNGIGAPDGRNGNNNAVGIYIEDGSQNYEIYNNYVWDVGQYGLYVHNAKNINVHDNYFSGDLQAVMIKHDDDAFSEIKQLKFKNNIAFFKKTDSDFPYVASFWNRHNKDSILGMVDNASDIDSNYYVQPIAPSTDVIYSIVHLFNATGTEVRTFHTLAEWQAYSGFDTHSATTPLSYTYATTENDDVFRMVYNTGDADSTVTLAQSYRDSRNQIYYAGSMTIPARTAIMLMESDDVAPVSSPVRFRTKNGKMLYKNAKQAAL